MKNSAQPTSGGLLGFFGGSEQPRGLLDIFGTGQPTQGGFDMAGLLGSPLLNFGLTTLANNGDMSKGLQQAMVASQVLSRNASRARRDERDDQRFQWEQDDRDRTQAQRQIYDDTLTGGADLGLTPQQIATAKMFGPEAGARYIAQVSSRPSFETVQSPYGRGGVAQRRA